MIDIDIPTLAVSSVILLGVVTPFISYSIKRKKAKAKFLAIFSEFTNGLNLTVDFQEDWRNRYILGIDKTKKVLVYFQDGESQDKRRIELSEVSRAVVHQSHLESDTSTKKTLAQVTLQLYLKNPSKKPLELEIYHYDHYSDLLGETILAAKWSELINQNLTK